MQQDFNNYSPSDHRVWRTLFERQMEQLPLMASKTYLEGIKKVGFVADRIPNFETETNPRLRALTGWEVEPVTGLIPKRDFFELLANQKFPASTWLRKPEQLDYLEEPDMFHDTFGHVPLLAHQPFCDFMSELSKVALRWLDVPEAIEQIGSLYWYTVEFGLIQEENRLKIYGGGILSSIGESTYCLRADVPKIRFDVRELLAASYHIDRFQDHYFVINSFEELYRSVPDIEAVLTETHFLV